MQESSLVHSKCKFCQNNSAQTRILLKRLYRRLKKQLQQIGRDSHFVYKKGEGNGFKQLIRILFPALVRQSDECQHPEYSNFFAQKLKIASKDLSQASSQLSYQIAFSNYQLELILAQIKNVSESIVDKKVEVSDESEESSINMSRKRKKCRKRSLRNRQINQRQQQKSQHSVEVNGSMVLQPQVRTQLSGSSLSDNHVRQYGYFMHYPIFFHTNHHIH